MIEAKIKKDVPLSGYTTYRIGGPAKYFLTAENVDILRDGVRWSERRGLPWFILGGGSNILVSDTGFPGLVIRLGGGFKRIDVEAGTQRVMVGGGAMLPGLGMYFAKNGWAGFTYMCGIPGTVGGAVRINAGTGDGEIRDAFLFADVLETDGSVVRYDASRMAFGYRHSSLAETRGIVLNAVFHMEHRDLPEHLKERVKAEIRNRKAKQPQHRRNCGSVFKNPPTGKSAGWYIEKVGLKGRIVGDALVSPEHGNWIVNVSHAESRDVKRLIEMVQAEVASVFGIDLMREVIYIPEDIDPS